MIHYFPFTAHPVMFNIYTLYSRSGNMLLVLPYLTVMTFLGEQKQTTSLAKLEWREFLIPSLYTNKTRNGSWVSQLLTALYLGFFFPPTTITKTFFPAVLHEIIYSRTLLTPKITFTKVVFHIPWSFWSSTAYANETRNGSWIRVNHPQDVCFSITTTKIFFFFQVWCRRLHLTEWKYLEFSQI